MFVPGEWPASGISYGFVLVPLVTIVTLASIRSESVPVSSPGGSVSAATGRGGTIGSEQPVPIRGVIPVGGRLFVGGIGVWRYHTDAA